MLRIYTLATCDTCRRAVKWLLAHRVPFEELPIRDQPPSVAELRMMQAACGGELRRLFNTSGRDYRELKLGGKLPGMTPAAAFALLGGNGNLVKRPFLIGEGVALLGFAEGPWKTALR